MVGTNIPEPDELHVPIVAPPPMLPLIKAFALLPHTVWSGPALAVPVGSILTIIVSETGKQFPFPVDVKTKVILPAVESAELAL